MLRNNRTKLEISLDSLSAGKVCSQSTGRCFLFVSWIGVPDFVQKMHNAAKRLHESRMAAGGSGVKCQKDYQQTNPM